MTAAKRKPRGTLARLEALEARQAERVQAVAVVRGEQTRQALDALDVSTLEYLYAHEDMQQEDGPAWARFVEVARILQTLFADSPNPDRLDAVAWCDAVEYTGDGVPFPVPDRLADFVAYFDEEKRNCDAALSKLDGLALPDGVSLDEARQVFEFARAGWKLWGSMGRVFLDWGGV